MIKFYGLLDSVHCTEYDETYSLVWLFFFFSLKVLSYCKHFEVHFLHGRCNTNKIIIIIIGIIDIWLISDVQIFVV